MKIRQNLSLLAMMMVTGSVGLSVLLDAIPVTVRDSIIDLFFVLGLAYISLFVGIVAWRKFKGLVKRAAKEQWLRRAIIKMTKRHI